MIFFTLSGSMAMTSAILNGKRPLGLVHARRLGERFNLPLDVFLAHAPD